MRTFYVAQVRGITGSESDVSIVALLTGSIEEVREQILHDQNRAPGTYLLLEKNAPIVRKPAAEPFTVIP